MRFAKITLGALAILGPLADARGSAATARPKRIVIAASTMLDGKGRVLRDTRIAIEGSKIVAIDPKAGPVDYDLRGLTDLPGWIDAHAHITWSFGKDGKNAGAGATTQEAAYSAASSAMGDADGGLHDGAKPGESGSAFSAMCIWRNASSIRPSGHRRYSAK